MEAGERSTPKVVKITWKKHFWEVTSEVLSNLTNTVKNVK